MLELLSSYVSEILSGFAGMVLGSFITYNITRQNRASGSSRLVDQSDARAGGDIVGGNKTTLKR